MMVSRMTASSFKDGGCKDDGFKSSGFKQGCAMPVPGLRFFCYSCFDFFCDGPLVDNAFFFCGSVELLVVNVRTACHIAITV